MSLDILGYQFPDTNDKEYDGNWLMVKIEIDCRLGSWKSTDPCLLTFELKELVENLAKSKNNGERTITFFTEPNLEFEAGPVKDDSVYLKVSFELESKPKYWGQENECSIEGQIPTIEFERIIEDFKIESKKYPERT